MRGAGSAFRYTRLQQPLARVLEVSIILVVQGREVAFEIEVRLQRLDAVDMGRGGGVVAEPGIGRGEEGVVGLWSAGKSVHRARMSELGLGCVKTSDKRAKCHFGSTVEIPASMKSMT